MTDYRVFGLKVRSEVTLPELLPDDGPSEPDVIVFRAKVAAPGQMDGFHAEDGALTIVIPGVASYRIEYGTRIIVDAANGVPDRNIRLFLLGSAFGALLHQRGMLPLHANAIEIDGRAVAFMGESGAGKSTLAAWFHDRGHAVLADDVCVIDFDTSAVPCAVPGIPRLRLWAEALDATGRDAGDYEYSYLEADQPNKFDVPIRARPAGSEPTPLAGLFLLDRANAFSIEQLAGLDAVQAVAHHTYRGAFVDKVKWQAGYWASALRLVGTVPAYRYCRRWDLESMNVENQALLDAVRRICQSPGNAGPANSRLSSSS